MTCIGALATKTVAEMVATIRAVGVERVTLGTDFGQKIEPASRRAGLQTYADALFAEGAHRSRDPPHGVHQSDCPAGPRQRGDVRCRASRFPKARPIPRCAMWKLRPEMGMGAGALSHAIYEQSIVPVRERELARMRIAQINDCAICQQWRKTAGAAEVMTEDDYAHVGEWRTLRRLLRTGTARDRVRRAVRARPPHARRRLLRAAARRVHRRRDPRPHRVHRRVARARSHAARARHRRLLPNSRRNRMRPAVRRLAFAAHG